MEKIQKLSKRESSSGVKLLNYLYEQPIVTSKIVMKVTGFTRSGALRVIDRFVELGILQARPSKSNYDVNFIYEEYLMSFLE